LGDAWADTTTPHGRLMVTVLGGLAEFERELILAIGGAISWSLLGPSCPR
jgi:resolvase-like protein